MLSTATGGVRQRVVAARRMEAAVAEAAVIHNKYPSPQVRAERGVGTREGTLPSSRHPIPGSSTRGE
eukprot:3348628-Prymnesium_polylepis.1